ncbi:PREDICTED: proprotein convertase subtilisin/kexin type 5-like [Thamnophis sirtalis]|uniref:Proprotein convertase subtilisin/kexin type 5-like n=1 Tax=Thamnophis sirtalis TaxID=35019 RepID=A0A6I9XAG9_9SAUR|nr:PREDICTED: proprotein convertase subtilisin/kexin type 5-like [Thamnophis sirtalis]
MVLIWFEKVFDSHSHYLFIPGNPETCTSCIHNYYMYNQQCYRTCPQTTVPDDNSPICIECQPNCQSCDRYQCYWCEEGFFLLGGTCVRDCGAGFYKDKITEECEPCYRTCKTCIGVNYNDCTSCQGNLQLLHGKCVNPQHKGKHGKFWNEKLKLHSSDDLGSAFLKGRFFPYVLSRSLRSAEIDPFSVSSRHQIEMERTLKEAFLENAQVLPKAFPFKAHQNPSLSVIRKRSTATDFQPCAPSCKTCETAADRCTSCPAGQFLFAGTCGHDCPPQTFRNTKTKQCENCTKDCEECITNQHCLKCLSSTNTPRYLHRGECLQECPMYVPIYIHSCKLLGCLHISVQHFPFPIFYIAILVTFSLEKAMRSLGFFRKFAKIHIHSSGFLWCVS